jgi:hypothetical protein
MSPAALADDIEPTPQGDVVLEPTPPVFDVDARPAPTLITEHEVAFSTAAALRAPARRRWTDVARSAAAALGGLFVASSAEPKPKRRHYPPRAAYLEDSRMDREMDRL